MAMSATARIPRTVVAPRLKPVARSASARKPPHESDEHNYWRARTVGGLGKRLFDIVVASAALLFLSPLLLTLGALIRLHDGGPALYRHPRIGVGGRSFGCLKLRSMAANSDALLERYLRENPAAAAEWERTRKLRDDPRITAVGQFIRKTSLDELPQLINVLKGEMSIVGPRPVVADELRRYKLDRVHYLSARPGISGLWQVSGRNEVAYEERVRLDKTYVTGWSLLGDFLIVLRTVPALLAARGVY